jgi:hypothetical protein
MSRWLVAAALLAGVAAVWQALPMTASSAPGTWDDGVVRFYDASGMPWTVATAAARWNASGAKVRVVGVSTPEEADVIVESDDAQLRARCGDDCLGYTTAIGRPSDGPSIVFLAAELGGRARPLSVWVAAHELGHVLGLRHRGGRTCSLMSEHAFDSSCAPSLTAAQASLDDLACVPAPADVDAAAKLYGGRPARLDPRCR